MEKNIKKENFCKNGSESFFHLLAGIAEKNANAACRGLMYEPTVPKKLQK